MPNAALWGLLAALLRFIPYAGPVVAALIPIALAFAVDPGWTKPALTIALFVILELVTNNVLMVVTLPDSDSWGIPYVVDLSCRRRLESADDGADRL